MSGAPSDIASFAPANIGAAGAAVLASAALTPLLAAFALRRGWVDDGSDAADRKLQARPVPPVGGTAIVGGCIAAQAVGAALGACGVLDWIEPARGGMVGSTSSIWIASSLALAYLVGLADDLAARGLAPQHKLAGQMLAAGVLAVGCALLSAEPRWMFAGVWFVAGVWAQNAMNTFDHADGAATALAVCGVAGVAPSIAGALIGFLPFNVWLRRGRGVDGAITTPVAYLGDSGSHLLGLALLLHPVTRWALFVPSCDLVRVVLARLRVGRAPWLGDRRHVAHRMLDAGWSTTATVVALCALALPALVGAALTRSAGPSALWGGVAVSFVSFLVVLRACPARA
jgi:UDP-GlcNAc:undecaprenyl-phosphate GlcNAc-1-phosphate transferase